MDMDNGYVKSAKVCYGVIDDLTTCFASHAASAWARLGLPEEDHDCKVTLRAWMTAKKQAYYTITLDYDEETEVFAAEGYSVPVRSMDGTDWSETAESGVWTAVAAMVGEDAADLLTGADLVRWMRVTSR